MVSLFVGQKLFQQDAGLALVSVVRDKLSFDLEKDEEVFLKQHNL